MRTKNVSRLWVHEHDVLQLGAVHVRHAAVVKLILLQPLLGEVQLMHLDRIEITKLTERHAAANEGKKKSATHKCHRMHTRPQHISSLYMLKFTRTGSQLRTHTHSIAHNNTSACTVRTSSHSLVSGALTRVPPRPRGA